MNSSRDLAGLVAGLALVIAAIGYRLVLKNKTTDAQGKGRPPVTPQTAIFDLVLTDVDGKAQSLQQWRGKVLVVNYWATWCHPLPRGNARIFPPAGQVSQTKAFNLSASASMTAPKIIEFQKETPVSYPLLIGDMKTMTNSAELGNSRQALPFTVVFDRNGNWHEQAGALERGRSGTQTA
jgi:thiol-disulfide isomerase/thioredoxin